MATAEKRHTGVVKSFKGSFGWISCPDVAAEFGGRDTFLHKKSINTLPIVGSRVAFRVVLDPKGNPKAEDAVLEVETTEAVDSAPTSQALRICRAALMLTRNDSEEVLVMRERDHKEGQLRWSDLGGKVEEGEELLECALRELAEESEGFLSSEAVALLNIGLRQRYGDGKEKPELVTLGGGGQRPQGVAVFRMDCTGCEELQPLEQAEPNKHDVHELRWLPFAEPALRDRQQTRWPLLRVLCALGEKRGRAPGGRHPSKSRSRSRSRSRVADAELAAAADAAAATVTAAA